MRFTKAVDIWALSDSERASLPIGQWVYAGDKSNMGRFYGQGASTVVAWLGNARGSKDYRGYMATIARYGRNVSNRSR